MHEHVFRLGERARTGLQALYDGLGVPGRRGGVRLGLRQLLPGGARRQLRRPAPQRRRPVLGLSPRADEGRHLRAPAEPEAEPLLVRAHRRGRRPVARRRRRAPSGATWRRAGDGPRGLLHDRPRGARQADRASRVPEDHEHRRLGEHVRPHRLDRERRGADRARPRPETTATSTRARSRRCACSRSCSPSRCTAA